MAMLRRTSWTGLVVDELLCRQPGVQRKALAQARAQAALGWQRDADDRAAASSATVWSTRAGKPVDLARRARSRSAARPTTADDQTVDARAATRRRATRGARRSRDGMWIVEIDCRCRARPSLIADVAAHASSRRSAAMSCCAPGAELAMRQGMAHVPSADELRACQPHARRRHAAGRMSVPAAHCAACIRAIETRARARSTASVERAGQSLDQARHRALGRRRRRRRSSPTLAAARLPAASASTQAGR